MCVRARVLRTCLRTRVCVCVCVRVCVFLCVCACGVALDRVVAGSTAPLCAFILMIYKRWCKTQVFRLLGRPEDWEDALFAAYGVGAAAWRRRLHQTSTTSAQCLKLARRRRGRRRRRGFICDQKEGGGGDALFARRR